MNILSDMLNLDKCKQLIRDCPKDETVILIPHYSINVQSKYYEMDTPNYLIAQGMDMSDKLQIDFDTLQQHLNCTLIVTDYDDLVADPHGIFSI